MKKNKHIANASFRTTIDYINTFKDNLHLFVKKHFNLIKLDLPTVSLYENNLNFLHFERKIDFDNANNSLIYGLINNYDNLIRYYSWFLNIRDKDVVFSEYNLIDRDKKITPYEWIENKIFSYEFYIKEEQKNDEYAIDLINFFIQNIWSINNKLEYEFVKKIQYHKLNIITVDKIMKMYKFLNIKEAVEKFVIDNNFYIIKGLGNKFFDKNSFYNFPYESYDFENTYSILFFDKNSKKLLELINFTYRPNWSICMKQKDFYDYEIKNEEYVNLLSSESTISTSNLKIYFNNLIYFLSNKTFLNEISNCNSFFNLSEIYKWYIKNNN